MSSSVVRIGGYDVFAKLGGGGMGEIYLARQTGPADFLRPVVLKVIREHLADDDQYRRMFLDEARMTATIAHPNVVHVLDFGEQDDLLYISMEYLDGESLATTMRRLARRKIQMPAPIIAHVLSEACAGLHAAHNVTTVEGKPLHVVHRDVSPSNIFVTFDGTVKVLDFGVARAEERLAESRAGRFGKMAYMSPEQISEQGVVDRRSDIFSLGIVLYELCTLQRLFRRQTHREIAEAILNDAIRLPSEVADGVPPQLDLICQKCLARRPDDRYQSALELRRDLLEVRQALGPAGQAPEEIVASFQQELFEDRQRAKARLQSDLQNLHLSGPLIGRLPTTSSSSNGPLYPASVTERHPGHRAATDHPKTNDSWFFLSSAISSAAPASSRSLLRIGFGLLVLFLLGVSLAIWSRSLRERPVVTIPVRPVPITPPPDAHNADAAGMRAEEQTGSAPAEAEAIKTAPPEPASDDTAPPTHEPTLVPSVSNPGPTNEPAARSITTNVKASPAETPTSVRRAPMKTRAVEKPAAFPGRQRPANPVQPGRPPQKAIGKTSSKPVSKTESRKKVRRPAPPQKPASAPSSKPSRYRHFK